MVHRSARYREDGTALVETAMVLPLAMAMLLGIFTGGSAYFQKISLVDAARDGARYGASLQVPGGGIADWRQAVQNRVVQLAGGQVTAADVCADLIVPTGTNTNCGVSDPTGASTDPGAQVLVCVPGSCPTTASLVKVSVTRSAKVEFIFFTSNATLSARIAARYERDIL